MGNLLGTCTLAASPVPLGWEALGRLNPSCFTTAASLFSSLLSAVKTFFLTSCFFPLWSASEERLRTFSWLLPLHLCHTLVSCFKDSCSYSSCLHAAPFWREQSDYCEHSDTRPVCLRVLPENFSWLFNRGSHSRAHLLVCVHFSTGELAFSPKSIEKNSMGKNS